MYIVHLQIQSIDKIRMYR